MKKTTLLAIALIMAMVTLVGCNNKENTVATEPQETLYSFPNAPDCDEISFYQKTVEKRLTDDKFFNDNEKAYLKEQGYYVTDKTATVYGGTDAIQYYFPILFNNENDIEIWGVNSLGDLVIVNTTSNSTNYKGNIHCPENDSIIDKDMVFAISYTPETGTLSRWEFGKKTATYSLPNEAIYCGVSAWEGYIFRFGTDVYGLKEYGTILNGENDHYGIDVIAHNVKYVIDADYRLTSDSWSQPLFLMANGSIKAYVGWEDKEVADSEKHLVDPLYEGGYNK